MKKLLFTTSLFFVAFSFPAQAQKELVISGGNSVSSFVCVNRKVYTWGNNKSNLGIGILGVGKTDTLISSPTLVTIPGGYDIEQINSGSGSHFLALDCGSGCGGNGGGIFAWGNNEFGQVGTGTSGNIVTTPARVKAGILKGISPYDDGSGNLVCGVKAVYAGNNNSFAILYDGRLIAWGANDAASTSPFDDAFGQLGDGTQVSKTTPVFVKTADGQPLFGVVQVYAGDYTAYALVDPDGDGVGTVYSWGNGLNGTLGRNARGTLNPISAGSVQDSYARPVFYGGSGGGTGQMNNIVAISSGDVFGMALDVNGYLWTWGNGGWNNATGNTISQYTGSDPRRVLAGNTTGASNDGTYLLAKSIGGGQGYGMALTVDGKPVAWGGQGLVKDPIYTDYPVCSNGGLTGTGIITNAIPPSYIKRGTNVDNDVIGIYRGDTWGYYQRADGTFYTWGCNLYGQLGIGNTINQPTAVPVIRPLGCDLFDPLPTVKISPKDTTVCASKLASNGIILHTGFVISPSLATKYQVTWKNGTSIVQGPSSATDAALSYTATSAGTYSATIHYVGTNASCTSFPDAIGYVTVSTTNNCIITGLHEEISDAGFLLYPNPTKGVINISSTESLKVRAINSQGLVLSIPQIQDEIDLSTEPAGIYFLQIQGQNKTWFNKVIKE